MAKRVIQPKMIEVRPGYSLNIHESGDPKGQPVVFIHGRASNFDTWEHQLPAFEKDGRFRVVAYDLNGHGHSDYVSHDKVEDHAEDLKDLLDALKIKERVDLVGHSDGTAVAQQFALDHPDRVRKMALISGYDHPPAFVRAQNEIALLAYFLTRKISFARNWVHLKVLEALNKRPAPGEPLHPPLEQLMEHFGIFNAFDIRKIKLTIVPPTLLIHSRADHRQSSIGKARLTEKWNASVQVIPEETHSPHFYHPDRVNPLLISFMVGRENPQL